MKEITEEGMLAKMAVYCSKSERCAQEVRAKIAQAGLPEAAAERIIARLREEKFIDEARYARFFVNDKARFNKWGRVKIGYELYKKEIPEAIREEALAAIDEEEYRTTLTSLLRAKIRTVKGGDGQEMFQKLLRFAAGRGFETQLAIDCLKRILNDSDEHFPDDN